MKNSPDDHKAVRKSHHWTKGCSCCSKRDKRFMRKLTRARLKAADKQQTDRSD